MKHSLGAALVCALLAPAVAVSAQSLGEAAARERARRKTQKAPAKVYTDADVRTATPETSGEGSGAAGDSATSTDGRTPAPAAGAEGAAPAEPSADEQRAEEEKAWRADVDKASAEVARLDAEITRLDAEANDTRGYLYSNRRTVALENLEKARADRTAAQARLDDVLESGRRKGFRAP